MGGHGYQHSCRAVDHLWEIVEISEQKPLSPFDWKDGDTVSSVFKSSDDHGGPAVQRTKRHGQDHNHGIRTKVHGAILFLTFSVFLPLGVFLIRSGTGNGFVLHWVIQLGAMIASIGAIMIMLVRSWSSIKVRLFGSSLPMPDNLTITIRAVTPELTRCLGLPSSSAFLYKPL